MGLSVEEISAKFLKLSVREQEQVADFIESLQLKVIQPLPHPENISPIYQAFEQTGLIGCIETDEQLSVTYKEKLDFSSKYGITQ
jgi:hypothetical protein